MQRLILNLVTVLLLAAGFLQAGFKSAHPHNTNSPLSYSGQIMNSNCAGDCAGHPSHNQETSKEGAKNSADCATCRKGGARLVLYSAEAKASFNLDDQVKPREYVGEKVAIVGTYDEPTRTIHVQSITMAR